MNIIKIQRIAFLLTGALLTIGNLSCNKMLDIKPDDYIISSVTYYKTKEQLHTALRGIYTTLADGNLYGGQILGRMGLEADEGFENYASSDRGTIGYYEGSTTDTKVLGYWRSLYQGINRANSLLAQVDNPDIEGITEAERNNIKGQALFLRGYYYFMLVNKFSGVPLILKPTTSGKAEEVQLPRTAARLIYDQVIADMEVASTLVADVAQVESGGRISKSAVWGVLSRVCLYMAGEPIKAVEKYSDAAKWAKKVIETNFHQLNPSYRQVFINYAQDLYDTKESIWEAEFYGNGTGVYSNTGGQVGRNNGIQYSGEANFGYSIGAIHPTQWLYNIYSANDLRRDWAIAPYRYVSDLISTWPVTTTAYQKYSGKFRREYEILLPKSTATTPQNFPLLRYSDVLLMYAEALNEVNMGPVTEAYNAINQVRRRAAGTPVGQPNAAVDLSLKNYSDFKAEIKKERARELCFESFRKNDLIRWGDFYTNMKLGLLEVPSGTASYITSARIYYSNAARRDVLWPIPSYEMGVNARLEQNDGW